MEKLESLQLPDCVTHNDLAFFNVYKPATAENYMFFDFGEGFLGHPFMSQLSGLNINR